MAADPYAYCAALTRDQWAWEFLRRNPDYRRDYQAFITIWRALEADYGAPPNRDFSKWKQDPRAYGPLPGDAGLAAPTGELCMVEDERVLLECWMGAKWGFYKFPLDPDRIAPGPDELSWRPPPPATARAEDDPLRVDVSFDLSLPLPPQLEAAKFRLVGRAAELRRQGLAAPKTVANQSERWTAMLRLLDGAGVPTTDNAALLDEARDQMAGGYRDLLRLADAAAGAVPSAED
ncbi:MAG: transcriptional regulator domain-containing protein [Gammaproteobacteria bacterium]